MHDPLLLPDLGRNVPEAIGGLQSLAKFGSEDPGQGSHGEQEVVPGREPGFPVAGQAARGDEVMNVRVIGQVASPGVQDPHHSDLAADEAGVLSQFLSGCGGGFEKQVVDQALVAAGDFVEPGGQGEGEQEVGHGKEQTFLLVQPVLPILVLAFRTVAVAAGVVAVLHPLAVRTAIHLSSQSFRPALLNGPHRLEMGERHAGGILLAVRISITPEDLRQLYCHRFSMSWLMTNKACSLPFWVR